MFWTVCFLVIPVSGFTFGGRTSLQRLPSIKMEYKPADMIQQLGKGPFGTEWTYNDFVDNLNKHNIDAATIADNNKIVLIDNAYSDIPSQNNIHLLKSLPGLTDNIVHQLIQQHVNFDVFNTADLPQMPQVPVFVQLVFFYILVNTIYSFLLRRSGGGAGGGMLGMNPFDKINKDKVDKEMSPEFDRIAKEIMDEIMEEQAPEVWSRVPESVKKMSPRHFPDIFFDIFWQIENQGGARAKRARPLLGGGRRPPPLYSPKSVRKVYGKCFGGGGTFLTFSGHFSSANPSTRTLSRHFPATFWTCFWEVARKHQKAFW